MAIILFGTNENPQEFLTDALAKATSFSDFDAGAGSSVYSLESGLYYLDSNIVGVGSNDLVLNDLSGVLRKSDKQNVFVKDNGDITNLNLPASGEALPSGELLVGNASNEATAVPFTGDISIDNAGLTTVVTDAITTAKIINDAVTSDKILNDAVISSKILNDAVISDKILNDAVTSDKILADAVTTVKILNDNVTTAKILDGNVTQDKIAANSLDGTVIGDLTDIQNELGLTGAYVFAVGSGTGATVSKIMPFKIEVLSVEVVNIDTEAGVATVQIVNDASAAITEQMSVQKAATVVTRPANLTIANSVVLATDNLTMEVLGASTPGVRATVVVRRVG